MFGFTFLLLMVLGTSSAQRDDVTNRILSQCGWSRDGCDVGIKFQYETGYKYMYKYSANIISNVARSSPEFSGLYVEADVILYALTPCHFTANIMNVNLRGRTVDDPAPSHFANGYQQFKDALEAQSIYFDFQDGTIDSMCVYQVDKPWVLNVKRGIVSMLQNRARDNLVGGQVIEKDVLGDCPTKYQMDYHDWTFLTVTKVKDLRDCGSRGRLDSSLQMTPFDDPSRETSNGLESFFRCTQEVKHKQIVRVSCEESYLSSLLANGDAGLKLETRQNLVLVDENLAASAPGFKVEGLTRTTLLFDHFYGVPEDGEPDVKLILSKLCSEKAMVEERKTPELFYQLVGMFRKFNLSRMTEVVDDVDRICRHSPLGNRIVTDILPMVGNDVSTALMTRMILADKISAGDRDVWLRWIALSKNFTEAMLSAVMPLVTVSDPSPHLLFVSSAANAFCKTNADCLKTEPGRMFLSLLESLLTRQCQLYDQTPINRVIVTLKSAGNFGQFSLRLLNALDTCSELHVNRTGLRVAALEAHRKLPCSVPRTQMMKMFEKRNEETEVRIAAYQQLIRCADRALLEKVLKVLRDDSTSKQVKSFVWSHLKSLQETNDPCKKHLSLLLEDVVDLEEMDKWVVGDIRKFSRFHDSSIYSEGFGIGSHLEAQMVYSTSSFLPRSMSLNLTVDIFGHSINLLQMTGRGQGLDLLAEGLFRPEPTVSFPKSHEGNLDVSGKGRIVLEPMEASFSAQIFGQEIWLAETDRQKITDTVNHLSNFKWADIVKVLSTESAISVNKNVVLFDTAFVMPTSTGFPLILNLNATANVHLKAGGKMDIKSSHYEMEGRFKHVSTILAEAGMTLDGYVGRLGTRLVTEIHTSFLLDGRVEKKKGEKLKIVFNLPENKMDLVVLSSKVVLKQWEKDLELKASADVQHRWKRCTGLETTLGVQLCSEILYPNASHTPSAPYFVLNGPASLQISVLKTDATLNSFLYHYLQHQDVYSDGTSSSFLLSFNTPKSAVDREFTIHSSFISTDDSFNLRLITPFKKFEISGNYKNEERRKQLMARLEVDKEKVYRLDADVRLEEKEGGSVYFTPKISIHTGTSTNLLSVEGYANYVPEKTLVINFAVEHLTARSILVKVMSNRKGKSKEQSEFDYEIVFNSPMIDANAVGSFTTIESGGMIWKTTVNYQLEGDGVWQVIEINGKTRLSQIPITTATAVLDIHTSAMPIRDVSVQWELQMSEGYLEQTFTVKNQQKTNLLWAQHVGTLDVNKLTARAEAKWSDVHFLFDFTHSNTLFNMTQTLLPNYFLSRLYIQPSSKERFYMMEASVLDQSQDTTKVGSHLKLKMDVQEIFLSLNITEETEAHYVIVWRSEGEPIPSVNATVTYVNSNTLVGVNQSLTLNATSRYSWSKLNVHGELQASEDKGQFQLDTEDHHKVSFIYERISYKEYHGSLAVDTTAVGPLINGKGKFVSETDFSLEETNRGFKVETLWMPNSESRRRKVVIDGKWRAGYDLRETELEVLWDADRNLSRHMNMSTFRRSLKEANEMSFKVSYLRKEILIEFDHKFQGVWTRSFDLVTHCLLQWDGIKRLGVDARAQRLKEISHVLNGALDLFTPLASLEEIYLQGSHQDDSSNWKSNGSLTVNNKWKFTMASSGKDWRSGNQRTLITMTNLTTPYEGIERIGVFLEHFVASRELKTFVVLDWSHQNSNEIAMTMNAIRPDSSYKQGLMSIELKTPFEGFESAKFVLKHDLRVREVSTWTKFDWNKNTVVYCALYGFVSAPDQLLFNLRGNVTVMIPINGLRNVTCVLNHTHGANSVSSGLSGRWDVNKFASITVTGVKQESKLGGHLEVVIPNTTYGASALYERPTVTSILGVAKGHWGNVSSQLKVEGNYLGIINFFYTAQLNTPIRQLDRVMLAVKNVIEGTSISSNIRGQLGVTTAEVTVEGSWSATGLSVGNFSFKTPWRIFPQVLVGVHHGRLSTKSPLVTGLEGQWDDATFHFNHSISYLGWTRLVHRMSLSLPFKDLENCSTVIDHSIIGNSAKDFLQVEAAGLKLFALTFEGEFKRLVKRNINALFRLDTSIWTPHGVEFRLSHEDDGVIFKPVVILKTMEPSGSLLEASAVLKSEPGKKWMNVTVADLGYVVTGFVIEEENVDFSFATNWRELQFYGGVDINFLSPRALLNVSSKNTGVFVLDGHYNVWAVKKFAYFFIQKNDWKIGVNGSGLFEPNVLDADLVMDIHPSPGFQVLVLNVSAAGRLASSKSFKLNLKWMSVKVLSLTFGLQKRTEDKTLLTASMKTPIKWLRVADVSVALNGDKSVETKCRWNRVHVVELWFQRRESQMEINLSSTHSALVDFKLNVVCKLEARHKKLLTAFEMNKTKWRAEMDLKESPQKVELCLELDTPSSYSLNGTLFTNFRKGFQAVVATPEHAFTLAGAVISPSDTPLTLWRLEIDGQESKDVTLTKNKKGQLMEFRFESEKGVGDLKIKRLDFSQRDSKSELEFQASATTADDFVHEISAKIARSSTQKLTLNINSPHLGDFRPLNLESSFKIEDDPVRVGAKINLRLGKTSHHLELEVESEETSFMRSKLTMQSPWVLNGTNVNGILSFSDSENGLNASFVTLLASGDCRVDMTYDRDLLNGVTALSIIGYSSIPDLETVRVVGKHRGREWDNMIVSFELTTPIEGYETFKSSVSTSHQLNSYFQLDVHLATPYEGYEEIRLNQLLNYTFERFDLGIQTKYRFDGYGLDLVAHCGREDGYLYMDGDTKWWPLQVTENGGEVAFKIDTWPTLFELKSRGKGWTADGGGRYNSWRDVQAELNVVTNSKMGFVLLNQFSASTSSGFLSYLTFHWANRTLTELRVQSEKPGEVYFNFTTPFSVVRKLYGRGTVGRDARGLDSSAQLVVNDDTVLNATLQWLQSADIRWTNRTAVLELDNAWQPIGIRAFTTKQLNVWQVDARVLWNFVRRELTSVGAIVRVITTIAGRDVELTLIHPKHTGQLRAGFSKTANDFEHTAKIIWGEKQLVFYNFSTSSTVDEALTWRRNANLKWEHPGRTVFLKTDVFRGRDGYVLLQTGLKLDQKRLGLELDAEYTGQRVAVTFKHPKLPRNIELTGELMSRESGTKMLDVHLKYLADIREDLRIKVAIFKFGLEGQVMIFHPASELDIATYWFTDKSSRANVSFHYDRHRLVVDGVRRLDKISGSVHVLAGTGQQLLNLLSIVVTPADPQNVTLVVIAPSVYMNGSLRTDNPYLRAYYVREGEPTVELEAGLDRTLKRFVYQSTNFGYGLDASLVFRLNTTRLLTARAYWTPGIVGQLKRKVLDSINTFNNLTTEWGGRIWNGSVTELAKKWSKMAVGMGVVFQPLTDEIKREVDLFVQDITSLRQKLMDMYYNSDFFMLDIWPLVENVYQSFRDYIVKILHLLNLSDVTTISSSLGHHFVSFMYSAWNQWFTLTANMFNETWNSFFDMFNRVSDIVGVIYTKIATLMASIPTLTRDWMSSMSATNSRLMASLSSLMALGERLKELWNGILDTIKTARDWLQSLLNEVKIWILNNSIYKFLRYELIGYVGDALVSVYRWCVDKLDTYLDVLRKYMAEEPRRVMDDFLSTVSRVKDELWKFFVYDIKIFVENYIASPVLSVYRKWIWCLNYLELWPHGYLTVFRWYSYWSDVFNTPAEVLADHYDSPNYILISSEQGKAEMDQVVPFPWQNFRKRPAINRMKEARILSKVLSYFYESEGSAGVSFLTKYYQLVDYNPWSWLPPFTGQALVAGRQHFVSFDGRVTDFNGSCNYVLAKDFLDGNFSVVINYEDRSNKHKWTTWSVLVEVDGSKVLLLPDFRVFVDNDKVELPTYFGHTSIKREETKVRLVNEYGLEVVCHWPFELCKVRVSGWYFGRVGGMFGTYNYESWDDRKTIEGMETENDLNWGKSWSVGSCHSKSTNVAFDSSKIDPMVVALCQDLFNGTVSLFRHCYSKVPSDSFMNMCLNDVHGTDSPDAICSSAAAYVETCRSFGVPIRMEKRCVSCLNFDGERVKEGGNVTVNSSSKSRSADVVFIVEAKKCNRGVVAMFGELVVAVDVTLQEFGVLEKRFAVVIFGGSGPLDHPHIVTLDSEVFSRQWHKATIAGLQLGRGTKDVFDAVKYASKLSFRPGASKTFVVATCSSGELIEMRPDYPEVHRMLLEDGVTLHLLLDRDFGVKKPDQFYGLDGIAAYTSKDSRSSVMRGDPDLRRQVAPPKDIYVPIALESNGSVFSSLYLSTELPKRSRKMFLDIFSRRIAQSADVDICHTCDCLPDEDGVGHLYCQPCVFPKPAHVYLDPEDFFNIEYGSIYQKYKPDTSDDEFEHTADDELEIERQRNRPKFSKHS